MTQAQEVYERSIRLGKLVPREIIRIRYVERAPEPIPVKVMVGPPIPEPMATELVEAAKPYLVPRKSPLVDDIIAAVAKFYEVSTNDIKSFRRTARIVRPRQMVMYLAKEMTLLSFPVIGRAIGDRDHTTVMHGVRKIGRLGLGDERLRDEIQLLKIKINERVAFRNTGKQPCAT